jgi:hypothetical protein
MTVSEFASAYKEIVSVEVVEEKALDFIKSNYRIKTKECVSILYYRFIGIEEIEDTQGVWDAFCKQCIISLK